MKFNENGEKSYGRGRNNKLSLSHCLLSRHLIGHKNMRGVMFLPRVRMVCSLDREVANTHIPPTNFFNHDHIVDSFFLSFVYFILFFNDFPVCYGVDLSTRFHSFIYLFLVF
jgi:hypothetical protein